MMDYIDYVKNPNLAMNKLIKTLNVGATTTLLPERVRFNITDKNHKARKNKLEKKYIAYLPQNPFQMQLLNILLSFQMCPAPMMK